jgi:hypothetical protein
VLADLLRSNESILLNIQELKRRADSSKRALVDTDPTGNDVETPELKRHKP